MNPYTFVPLAGAPHRERAAGNDLYRGTSGTLRCTLSVLTPLFLYDRGSARAAEPPAGQGHEIVQFPTTAEGQPLIWATALRGTIRGVAEAVSPSCLSLFDGHYERWTVDYRGRLPNGFRRCEFPDPLCPACRLFGTVGATSSGYAGAVQISDALPAGEGAVTLGEQITVSAIQSPKPHHAAFYLSSEGVIAGRKFYYHRPQGALTTTERSRYTRTVQPAMPGSTFTFTVRFANLNDELLRLLLFALTLQPGLGHKVGMGKPLGMGSVTIAVEEAQTLAARDQALQRPGEALTGDRLREWTDALLYPMRNDGDGSLEALRGVLTLDPGRPIAYPTAEWFASHPDAPLAATPDFLPSPRRPFERAAEPAGAPYPSRSAAGPRPSRRPERGPAPVGRGGPPRPPREPAGQRAEEPRAPRPPRPTPPEPPEEEPVEPARPATLEDLVRRFSRQPEPARQEQAPRETRESQRAREEQRRLMERLRRGQG